MAGVRDMGLARQLLVLVIAVLAVHVLLAETRALSPGHDDEAITTVLSRLVTMFRGGNLTKPMGSLECDACKLALDEVVGELAKNATQQKLIGLLEEVCQKLPDVDDCVDFFKKYGQQLIGVALLVLSPQNVCDFVGVCNASSNALEALAQHAPAQFHGAPLPVH